MPFERMQFLAGFDIPYFDRVLLTRRDEAAPVRAECQSHRRDVGLSRTEIPAWLLLARQMGRIPEIDHPIGARRDQVAAVAAERHGAHILAALIADRAYLSPGACVPDFRAVTRSPCHEAFAVGAERHRVSFRAGREFKALFACPGVPDPDNKQLPLTIPTGGGDAFAVGVPSQAKHDRLVFREFEQYLARPRIPHLDRRIDVEAQAR